MEVIHIILGKANPNRMNGVNKVVNELAKEQHKAGLNVEVWGITKDVSINYESRIFKTRLFLDKHNSIFKIDKSLKKALKMLSKKSIIHIHGAWIPKFYTIGSLLKILNVPYIITPHGGYNTIAMNRNKWVKKIYFSLFEKTLLKNAQTIHLLGESEYIKIQEMLPQASKMLLPYGFSFSKHSNTKTSRKEDFIIGFIGRLDIFTKGLDILLNAFNDFNKTHPKAKLWIIGDSFEKAILSQMITKNSIKNVHLFGAKYGNEKIELLNKMDIFVHPSRNEGLPAAVIEAASLNIPCVVSKESNLAKYIDKYNAGVSLHKNTAENLSISFKQLYKIWNSEEFEFKKTGAKKMLTQAFSWKKLIPKYQKMYNQCLEK